MHGWRLMSLIGLLGLWLLPQQVQSAVLVRGNAALGTITTATLAIDNTNYPASTVQLYEAWINPSKQTRPAPRPALRVGLPAIAERVDPQLQQEFARTPSGTSEMLVYLADQADLSVAAAVSGWNERGEAVYRTLRQHAATTQAALLGQLHAQGYQPRSYWIVNAIAVQGDARLAKWMAAQPEVALVAANHRYQLDANRATTAAPNSAAMTWGLATIKAPQVWQNWGIQGQGIVVANIDTGVYFTHTALLRGYRGWTPTGISHDYNWYDPTNTPFAVPSDLNGHGTHTMGTLAGRTEGITRTIGVAPGVRWIAARGCESGFCADADLIDSAQWMLAPTKLDGTAPRPDLRPHIISNSWGDSGEGDWYMGYVEAWNAAGILSVFANGNQGGFGCRTSTNPANYALAFGVGATDSNDYIADFSSRGPTANNRTKPDLTAPGVGILSAAPDGTLVSLQGTSMATPHVAGAAALLWSGNPALIGDLPATYQLLTSTSVARASSECGDMPGARPNSVYGWGRLDAFAAVQTARTDVPWLNLPASVDLPANKVQTITVTLDARQVAKPGIYPARILLLRDGRLSDVVVQFTVSASPNTGGLSGQLVDFWTGKGVYGWVSLSGGPQVRTDATGVYTLTLPYNGYNLTAGAVGYVATNTRIRIPDQATAMIKLMPDQPHVLAARPPISSTLNFGAQQTFAISISNAGPQPLTIAAQVPPVEWSSEDSLAAGPNAPLYDLSRFPALPLVDDQIFTDALDLGFAVPIYGGLASKIYVSSNGWVTTQRQRSAVPSATCLPTTSLPPASLAPFWADLDPSKGGAIRAGRVLSDTFVISYEAVPLWQDEDVVTSAPTYTFQLTLHADGRVQYRYGPMGNLPAHWGIGTSNDGVRGQSLACQKNSQILSGRTWTLRNQALSTLWLQITPATLLILPNTSMALTATLIGVGATPWRALPAEGVMRLGTNDPYQPILDVPAFISVRAPPYQVHLPFLVRQ